MPGANWLIVLAGVAGDLVEEVKLIDDFTNPKTGKTSNCFRIAYRSNERSLTDDEINSLQVNPQHRSVQSALPIGGDRHIIIAASAATCIRAILNRPVVHTGLGLYLFTQSI